MIEVRDLTVSYPRSSTRALDGVSLVAPPGQVTAIAGPNGSGKSTLVRVLLGRLKAERGEITVAGVRSAALAASELARAVAIIPQREEPAFAMPVREFIALGRHAHRSAWRAEGAADREAIERAVTRAGVEELMRRSTDELSGGEWQRVRIARALAQATRIIVLDEPTTFLDVAHEMAVFELLAGLARDGAAVLLVSHALNLVARFADQIHLLHHGRIAACGSPDAVMRGEVLEKVYEWPLVVTRDPAIGAPALVPLRVPRT